MGGMGRKEEVAKEVVYFCGTGNMKNMIRMRELREWLDWEEIYKRMVLWLR